MDSLTAAIHRGLLAAPGADRLLAGQPSALTGLVQSLERSIRQQLGGANVYVAKHASREQLRERDERMRCQFTGNNLDQLASQYGMTERHARRVLTRSKK